MSDESAEAAMIGKELALLEISGAIATITLNDAEHHNSFDEAMVGALLSALQRVEDTPSVRCLLLTGVGSVFSAGGRVDAFADLTELPKRIDDLIELAHRLVGFVARLPIPVVMVLNGVVAGGALGLVLAGDYIIAVDSVRLRTAYAALGLVSDCGVSQLLPQAIGMRRARHLMLTNRMFTAAEAMAWGMIDEVVEPARLSERANDVARELAAGPTGAYRRIKLLLGEATANSYEGQLARERELMGEAAAGADVREGIRAFLDKRPPKFVGR